MHITSAYVRIRSIRALTLCVFSAASFIVTQHTSADTETAAKVANAEKASDISLIIGDLTEVPDNKQINDWFSIETKLGTAAGYRSEIENVRLCPLQKTLCDLALSQRTRGSIKNRFILIPSQEAVATYVDTLNAKVRKEPIDAKFTVSDGKISAFSLSQEGMRIDTDRGIAAIMEAIGNMSGEHVRKIVLPTVAIAPNIPSSNADNFGIVELIGEGRTNFAGSPKNRVHNFKRAMEQFNGIMVAPQAEFSFVELLGDVDGEHGYLPELVIKKDKTEPEFGGGICQVSSTVFRAAIYSGLKITARRNHAYPVSYYKPYGMDATIYVPKPDFKFINNTPGHILMQTSIEGTQLIFRFYGTSDGRKTEVDGPHILESNPDGSMKTIFTQKVTDTQGNTLIDDSFRSNYASPSKYPHPGQEPVLTEKPSDWSSNQWADYKKIHGLR